MIRIIAAMRLILLAFALLSKSASAADMIALPPQVMDAFAAAPPIGMSDVRQFYNSAVENFAEDAPSRLFSQVEVEFYIDGLINQAKSGNDSIGIT